MISPIYCECHAVWSESIFPLAKWLFLGPLLPLVIMIVQGAHVMHGDGHPQVPFVVMRDAVCQCAFA